MSQGQKINTPVTPEIGIMMKTNDITSKTLFDQSKPQTLEAGTKMPEMIIQNKVASFKSSPLSKVNSFRGDKL